MVANDEIQDFWYSTMTREEADELQKLFDSYAEAKKKGKSPMSLSMMRMILAPKVEELLPYEEGAGPGGIMDLVGPILKVFAPKAFDKPLKVAVVDGHEEVFRLADDFDDEAFYEKYGVEVPGDLVEAAMERRAHSRLFKLGEKAFSKKENK